MAKKITKFLESKKGRLITIVVFGIIGGGIGFTAIFREDIFSSLNLILNPIPIIIGMLFDIWTNTFHVILSIFTFSFLGFLITAKRKWLYLSLFIAIYIVSFLSIFLKTAS